MPENYRNGNRKAKSPIRPLIPRESPRNCGEAEIETDSHFCELCLAGLDGCLPISEPGRDVDSPEYEHYRDLDSWRSAADDGCYFCALLWRRLRPKSSDISRVLALEKGFQGIWVQFYWGTFSRIRKEQELKKYNITVDFELRYSAYSYSMDFYLEVLRDDERVQRIRAFANAGISGAELTCQKMAFHTIPSQEAWSCARTWIAQCTSSHIRCNALRDETWQPSRLLEIQEASHNVWLVETHKCSISGPYATLSHRWPPDFHTTLILRPETYDLFCPGVPIADLPQTVQDSITCCKSLSIRYLWVDCMCIIQNADNPVDWREQASVMDKVYTHSHLNLSAVTAENTKSGMFQPRDAISSNGMVSTSIAKKLGGSRWPRRYRVINPHVWTQNVSESHLNARAWILQERVLSPRILHFGFGQLFWECCMGSATEEYPIGLPPFMEDSIDAEGGDLKNLDPGTQKSILRNANSVDRGHGFYKIWARIVGKYSTCGLTKSSDKLVALSGLAKRLSNIVDDAYVAGMWRRHLPTQLFWGFSRIKERRSMLPVEYRAPSFSWAAIDEAIEFPSLPDHDSALTLEIVGVHLHYETEDVFGAITGGHLTVRSYLHRVSLPLRDPSDACKGIDAFQILRLDGYGIDGAILESVMYQDGAADGFFDEILDCIDPYVQEDLYCIPRASRNSGFFYLLILQLVDREKAYYARRGRVSISGRSEKDGALLKRLQTSPSDPSLHYPCIAYDGGEHTIRLI